MANPSSRWDQVPVYGVYLRIDDQPSPGTVTFALDSRVTRVDGRVIYPDGAQVTVRIGDQTQQNSTIRSAVRAAWRTADAAAAGGSFDGVAWDSWWDDIVVPAAIFTGFPAADDPDIVQHGYQVVVREQLQSGGGKQYGIQPLLAQLDLPVPGINLGLVEVPPGSPSVPAPMYAKGVPGGVAALDADGDVLDADGNKIGSVPGGAVSAEEVRDIVGTALEAGSNVTISVNDAGDTIIISADGAPIDDAGSPAAAKVWSSQKVASVVSSAVSGLAVDVDLVKLSGVQTISGAKTFSIAPAVPNNAFGPEKIAGFAEAAQDAVAALVTGTSGVTVSYDDAANVLTIAGTKAASGITVTPSGALTSTDVQAALEQLVGMLGSGTATDEVSFYYSSGAYPAQPASAPVGVRRRHFYGPTPYAGPTWAGVIDLYDFVDLL